MIALALGLAALLVAPAPACPKIHAVLDLDPVAAKASVDPLIVTAIEDGALTVELLRTGEPAPIARGAFPIEPSNEGWQVGWKQLQPLTAVELGVLLPGVERTFAVRVALEYWGGAGAGLVTDNHRVVYVVGKRGDRLDVLFATVYGADWIESPTCPDATNACIEGAEGVVRSWRAEITVHGCTSRPQLRVTAGGAGSTPAESQWSPADEHFLPRYLVR